MEITLVTNKQEREEYKKAIDTYCNEKVSSDEKDKLPKKVWVDLVNDGRGVKGPPFVVVDNTQGNCFIEEFETLDGAILYAAGIYLTPENQSDWDYMGALKDGGDLTDMKKWQSTVDAVTLEGFTEKEIAGRIKKEKRRIERIKSKMQEMRYDLHATHDALDVWKGMKKRIQKLKKGSKNACH